MNIFHLYPGNISYGHLSVFAECFCTDPRAENMEPIEVVKHKGLTLAYDGNRRLYVYKKLRSLGDHKRE